MAQHTAEGSELGSAVGIAEGYEVGTGVAAAGVAPSAAAKAARPATATETLSEYRKGAPPPEKRKGNKEREIEAGYNHAANREKREAESMRCRLPGDT